TLALDTMSTAALRLNNYTTTTGMTHAHTHYTLHTTHPTLHKHPPHTPHTQPPPPRTHTTHYPLHTTPPTPHTHAQTHAHTPHTHTHKLHTHTQTTHAQHTLHTYSTPNLRSPSAHPAYSFPSTPLFVYFSFLLSDHIFIYSLSIVKSESASLGPRYCHSARVGALPLI